MYKLKKNLEIKRDKLNTQRKKFKVLAKPKRRIGEKAALMESTTLALKLFEHWFQKCVGGSAQGEFNPGVVQCYNRGWDGIDVQWECRADMDNLYRFGEIEVVCEGENWP